MGNEVLETYLKKVNEQYRTGIAKEHAYRGALGELVDALLPQLLATNEPVHVACGAPDFAVCDRKSRQTVFYIEAKDIGDGDLDGRNVHREQFDRYRQGLSLVIFTDYLDFHFYRGETLVEKVRIAEEAGGRIRPVAENFERLLALLADFAAATPEKIKSPSRLAALMAAKARMLALSAEKALKGTADVQLGYLPPIRSLYDQFRQVLIADTDEHEFADIFAQTVTYGLFAARLHDPTPEDFSREEAERLVPASNPFLKHLFHQIAENTQPEIEWNLADLVALFAATDITGVMCGYGKATATEDPMIHFYEDFLAKYDAGLRKNRGVWYTPQPVVGFMVRAVDWLLEHVFNLEGGLANDEKVEIEIENEQYDGHRTSAKVLKRQVHKVQVLDPATGTATFLAAVVRLIHAKMSANAGLWPGYVADSLLPRLHGFEILMASYAMAHLKLDFLLSETGYTPLPGRRLNVFLTNSLEKYSENSLGPLFSTVIGQEAAAADYIKRDCPVMVVIGNPPYSGVSYNTGAWIDGLLDVYKREPGGKEKLKERKTWLNDDYVKFIRFAEHHVEKNGEGIVAFINPRGYLDNATFRGMRWHLLKTFDNIYTIDLHGDSKKHETAPDGSKDENVFDIMQGVSINIFVKRRAIGGTGVSPVRADTPHLARVHHLGLYGLRQTKFNWLDSHDLANAGFTDVTPQAPYYFFKPTNDTGREEYEKGFKLDELMPFQTMGVVSANDNLNISFTDREQRLKIDDLISLGEGEWRTRTGRLKDSRDWTYATAREDALANRDSFTTIAYRPLDIRHTCYTGNSRGLYSSPQPNVMRQFIGHENVGLCALRLNSRGDDLPVLVTDKITDKTILSSKDNANVFPLWLYAKDELNGEVTRKANFDETIYAKICAAGTTAKTPSLRTPAEIRAFLEGEPVARLTGHEFEGVNGIKALKQAIYDSYESVQWRSCRSDIGTVQLSRSGINDSLCHGFGRMKVAAFAALPQLIARGMAVRRSENWKGRGYDSVVLVAPVEIGAVAHCAFIIVNSMKDGGYRFYLHEVGRLEDMKKAGGMRTGFADRSVLSRTPGSVRSLAFSLWAVNGDSTGTAVTAADAQERIPPEQVFDYIYAVLHDVGYREKYREFLKVDFPRIPYPTAPVSFERLATLGSELRELHLMKRHAPRFGALAAFPVAGTNAVEGAKLAEGRVWINGTQYFDGVDESVWEMKIGGYQPAQKWLKDRKGRTLANEEIGHYRDIVFVLGETRRIMGEIKEVCASYG